MSSTVLRDLLGKKKNTDLMLENSFSQSGKFYYIGELYQMEKGSNKMIIKKLGFKIFEVHMEKSVRYFLHLTLTRLGSQVK